MNGFFHSSIHILLWSFLSNFGSEPLIEDWPPHLNSHLLLCLSRQVFFHLLPLPVRSFSLSSHFSPFLSYFDLLIPQYLWRTYCWDKPDSLPPQSQTTTPVDNLSSWSWRQGRSLQKSCLPSTARAQPGHQQQSLEQMLLPPCRLILPLASLQPDLAPKGSARFTWSLKFSIHFSTTAPITVSPLDPTLE